MRWKKPLGSFTTTKTKFLFLPLTIGCETRWLEKVTYEIEHYTCLDPLFGKYIHNYTPSRWIDLDDDQS